jgi:hypothetical protein
MGAEAPAPLFQVTTLRARFRTLDQSDEGWFIHFSESKAPEATTFLLCMVKNGR